MDYIYLEKPIKHKMPDGMGLVLLSTVGMILFSVLPIALVFPTTIRLAFTASYIVLFYTGVLLEARKRSGKIFLVSLLVIVFDLIIYYSQWRDYTNVFTKSYWLFIFWFPLIQAFYYIKIESKAILKLLTGIILAVLAITSLTTIIGSNIFPMASRLLASPTLDMNRQYIFYNIGGYGFIYSLVIIIPGIIYLFNTTRKVIYLILLILFYLCILKAEYTISLLLSVSSLYLLFTKKIRPMRFSIVIVTSFAIFDLFKMQIANIINELSNIFIKLNVKFLAERFGQIYILIVDNRFVGGAAARPELYNQSLNVFFQSPVFGNLFSKNMDLVGGHSEVFDLLGSSGIFGFGFCIAILLLYRKYVLEKLKPSNIFSYAYYTLFLFLIIGCVNTLFVAREIGIIVFFALICFRYVEIDK